MDSAMSEWARSSLLTNRVKIIDTVRVDYVLNYLIQDRVIDTEESEIIEHENTGRKRATKLLDILGKKNQAAYFSFYGALKENYPDLAEFLEDDIPSDEMDAATIPCRRKSFSMGSIETILVDGGVPPQPNVYINRPDELAELREELWNLQYKAGWVVVHGMGGCGKSIMAAEAVRDPELVADCFPGGVFWAHIGPIDNALLLMKIVSLCYRLDKERRARPQNIEEAKDRLREILIKQYPRSLLILDDVWRAEVTKAFDNQTRVMVTTRDISVMDLVSGSVHKVHISKGLSEEESKDMLAKWTNTNAESLPDEATDIFSECKGLPLCISMVGALLADHPDRWASYAKKLKERQTRRLRKRSSYEYDTLYEAITISINNLSDDMRRLYQDFALFDETSKVPSNVLCILWDEDVETVEDIMFELVNKSMAVQEYDKKLKCYIYSVHNLQLDVLKESSQDLRELHKKLVIQYRKSCGGAFHKLKDDHYTHWYLARHMVQAEMYKELWDLLLDLDWLEAKIQTTGPADLLTEYINYSEHLDPEQEANREGFQTFVSVNSHYFKEKDLYDLTQLALCQPSNSEVFRQAKKRALNSPDKFYVDWRNKESFTYACLLTNKGHEGAVKCAQFSPHGSKVVSCSSDKTVKVWDSQSGHEYLSMTGHNDFVNWCCFSPDTTMIASCSDDKTVRIWNAHDGSLIYTFKQHENEVSMCCWSHDSKRVASCSHDWSIQVWDVITGKVTAELSGHDQPVKACSFSPDDLYLVSCSQDSTVKVWDISKEDWIANFKGHDSSVSSCCFSPDGNNIASCSNNYIKIWIAHTGQLLNTCDAKTASLVLYCTYSPDGNLIAAGLSDFSIQIWNSTSCDTLSVFKGHSGWVYVVDFDNDGERLLSAADDGTTMIWDVEGGQNQEVVGLKRDFAARYTENDSIVIVAPDLANRIRIICGQNGDSKLHRSQSQMTPCEECRIRSCDISSTNEIAYGTDKGQVKVISLEGQILHNFPHGHTAAVRWCCYSQDGHVLITCSDDKTVKIWKEYGDPIVCTGHTDSVRYCRLFDNDTRILSSSNDGTIKVWDARTGKLKFSCNGHKEWVLSCDVSPDESLLVSTSTDRTAKIWNANNGELQHTLKKHKDCIRSCRISANSQLVATGDDQGIIQIWNTKTAEPVSTCTKHHCWVTDIQWSPDSRRLVSVSENIKWWDVDGNCLQTLPIKGSFSKRVQVLDDFKTFITIDSAGILYILPVVENGPASVNGE